MKIEIKLFYDLAQYLPPGSGDKTAHISITEGMTVKALTDHLGLPADTQKTILVNGIKAEDATVLKDNDSVAVFPPMAGG